MQCCSYYTEGMTYAKKPCIRCLLEEAGRQDLSQAVRAAIDKIPSDKRTDDDQYAHRLDICRECEFLSGGTCLKCGCYSELRAARKDSHCPLKSKKW